MQKLVIANRGEIAVRIIRAARELGIRTVALASEADLGALHTRLADQQVVIGPAAAARSYLDPEAVLAAAVSTGADAVHPGYGFLSERADFAERVAAAGLTFVGPSAEVIRLMGDKAQARRTAAAAGVPTVPGSPGPVTDLAAALAAAEQVGYPVVVKAAAGGGGRGIRVVDGPQALAEALPVAKAEARAAFGNDEVYLERFVPVARHVEVQVFGDGQRVVHLGERDCSLQRRRQKVVEEAGAPGLPGHLREQLLDAAVRVSEQVGYAGAGTVEFLYDTVRGEFYFIEMNTRIQVEHPVTELVTGRDLITEQLTVAAGQPLSFRQDDVSLTGHAIELRLTAEDPDQGFMPSPGTLARFRMPAGPFVRVDSGCEEGGVVSPFYDSLLAKVVVWGRDRPTALRRARRALDEVEIRGVTTNVRFLRALLDVPEFLAAGHHTRFLEEWMSQQGTTSAARDGAADAADATDATDAVDAVDAADAHEPAVAR